MGEWLKPTDLKSVKAARSSVVRIPLPPPSTSYYSYIPSINNFLKKTSRSIKVLLQKNHTNIIYLIFFERQQNMKNSMTKSYILNYDFSSVRARDFVNDYVKVLQSLGMPEQ